MTPETIKKPEFWQKPEIPIPANCPKLMCTEPELHLIPDNLHPC